MFGVGFHGAGADPVGVAVVGAEAADVDGPEVSGGFAAGDPFGEHFAGAAARGDAESVEAGADEEAGEFGGLAQDEVAVRSKAFRAVDEGFDAGGFERGDAANGEFHDGLEMVPVGVEELVGEILRDALDGPGDGVGLVAAHDEAADFLLVVGQAVWVAQGGEVFGGAGDGLGDHVLVLDGDQGDVDADGGAEGAGPLAAADDDGLGGDAALVRDDGGGAAVGGFDAGDWRVLEDFGAVHARTLGEGQGDVGRVGLAVGGEEGGADEVVDLHERPEVLGFLGGEEVHFQAEGAGGGGLALDLCPTLLVAGEAEAAVHFPAGGEAGFSLQRAVEFDGFAEELGDAGRGAELADQAGGVEGAAGGEFGTLQEGDLPAEFGEVVRGGAADDAAANDDGARLGGEGHGAHHSTE